MMDDFDGDFNFDVAIYSFYFIHGRQSHNTLYLEGKLKEREAHKPFRPFRVIVLVESKHLFIKPRQNLICAQDRDFQSKLEKSLKSLIKDIDIIGSEVVYKHTIYDKKLIPFLKVQYKIPQLSFSRKVNIPCTSLIEYIYGFQDDILETFLLDKNIKGPCWLYLETFHTNLKHNATEIQCNPHSITIVRDTSTLQNPPLNVIYLDVINVISASGNFLLEPLLYALAIVKWNELELKHMCTKIYAVRDKIQTKHDSFAGQDITWFDNSHMLIQKVNQIFIEESVDIIICYQKERFLQVENRCAEKMKNIFHFHVVMDLKQMSRELYPSLIQNEKYLIEYFFANTCKELLRIEDNASLGNKINWIDKRVNKYLQMIKEIDLISIALLLANQTGCSFKDISTLGPLRRVEMMLKYELRQSNIITPDSKSCNTRALVLGGKTIEPKIGYYDDLIVSYDFKSLYPSIIREFKLSFTKNDNVLPKLMDDLQHKRDEVAVLETHDYTSKKPLRSAIIKLLANSVYGCLSSMHSIFYSPILANRITKHGRDLLTALEAEIPDALNCTVISGHTDSVFVKLIDGTDFEGTLQKATRYAETLNARYTHIQIKLEGVFSHGVIFSKQKYALRYHNSFRIIKGNILQEPWIIKGVGQKIYPRISCELFQYFLERIVVRQPQLVRTKQLCSAIYRKFKSDNGDDYAMHFELHEDPKTYSSSFVKLVQRKNRLSAFGYQRHDTVSYVICNNGTNKRFFERAYSPEEIKSLNLEIDKNYYKRKTFLLLNDLLHIVPEYINLGYINSFLNPETMDDPQVLKRMRDGISNPYKTYNVLNLHFYCVQCYKYVTISGACYTQFVCCEHCQGWMVNNEQFEETKTIVTRYIDERLKKLDFLKNTMSIAGRFQDKIRSKLDVMEFRFTMQVSYWLEVVREATFTLEFSNDNEFRLDLRRLFKALDEMLEDCLVRILGERKLETFKFETLSFE